MQNLPTNTHPSLSNSFNLGGALSPHNKPQSFVSKTETKYKQLVKGQSRINYVPFEKKMIEYEERVYTQKVPVVKKITEFQQRKVVKTIPREVIKREYMAVQRQTHYVKQVVAEKKVDMVPVQKKIKRTEYVPVQKQTVHYPDTGLSMKTSRHIGESVLSGQGFMIQKDASFKPLTSNLIYEFTQSTGGNSQIIYHDKGIARPFGNTIAIDTTLIKPNSFASAHEASVYSISKVTELIQEKKDDQVQNTENTQN